MPSKIRFHLDENVRVEIAIGLRRYGIDVTTSGDAHLLGADDTDQLSYAKQHHRVLVTHDRDLLVLHAKDQRHAGICYCHAESRSIGEMLRRLVLICSNTAAEDMRGCVTYL